MKATDNGYAPVPGHLTTQVRDRPELHTAEVPELSISEYEPLLDSANARPSDWLRIARDLGAAPPPLRRLRRPARHGHDGLHGVRAGLPAAGAGQAGRRHGRQIPLGVLRSDGRQNLLTAVLVAARDDVREVCLVFGSQILRGCRAVKASASGFEAFTSPNLPPLGVAGVQIEIDPSRLRARSRARSGCRLTLDAPVEPAAPVSRHAGRAAARRARRAHPRAVLEAYGAGTVPTSDRELLQALSEGARAAWWSSSSPVRRRPRGPRRLRDQRPLAAGGRGRRLRHDHRSRLREARRAALRGTRAGRRARASSRRTSRASSARSG